MQKKPSAALVPFGLALLAVALATAIQLALDPRLGGRFPFLAFFVAIGITTWYGGLSPSLLAVVLSWFAVNHFVLRPLGPGPIFGDKSQIVFPFFAVGLTITLLCEAARDARLRARSSAAKARGALEAQQAQREWLRITLASIADAVITTDSEGRVNSLNPAAERLTGRTLQEAAGRPLMEVFRAVEGATDGTADVPVARVVQEGEAVLSGHQTVLLDGDGSSKYVEHHVAPIKDDRGEITGVVIVMRDITERRQAEQALREADRRKGEFLATLAHELRNPLAPLQTALDLMKQAAMTGAEVERERAVMERQVRHLTRLVDDLLDIARISRGRVELRTEVVDLAGLVAQAVEVVRPRLDVRRQGLQVSLPEGAIHLKADPTRLEQILTNLLANAIKYTDEGGQIRMTAERAGAEVTIRVQDTGIGMTPDMLPHVFDLFMQGERRLDRAQGGLGIGLSLVKSLVELHAGIITAHSEGPGRGSEFIVRLPILAPTPAEGADPPPPYRSKAPSALPRRRILIVDDNVDAAESLGRLLATVLGQEVQVVYDGPAALDVVGSLRPEVVLLDLGMASMDGFEVAMRLRERPEHAGLVIVAVTGWGQAEDRRRTEEMGFDYHLIKPIRVEAIRDLLLGLGSASSACRGS